jgi:hypothetical protein
VPTRVPLRALLADRRDVDGAEGLYQQEID